MELIKVRVYHEQQATAKGEWLDAGLEKSFWLMSFPQVPSIGEYIIIQLRWMRVTKVFWSNSGAPGLCVTWDGGME